MNLTKAYEDWKKSGEEEFLSNGRQKPVKWIRKLKAYKNKKRIEKKKTHAMIGSHERADI